MKNFKCLSCILFVVILRSSAFANGNHFGEQEQLDATITFTDSFGQTVTDASGTYYQYWGYSFYEPKVYPEAYWGVFPLYFFGYKTGIQVTVTNKGPRNTAKLRIRTECYVLNTDGTNGVALLSPADIDIEIKRGETRVIDASFIPEFVSGAESGLDRFVVKLLHPNQGGGSGNAEPALIYWKEGIFCPPEFQISAKPSM